MSVLDVYFAGDLTPIRANSLSVDHQFSLRSTCRCTIISRDASYSPELGNDFKAYQDDELIFGGIVTSITRRTEARSGVLYSDIAGVDYSIFASKQLTGERYGTNGYANWHLNDIILDLIANCLTANGIITTEVAVGGGPIIPIAEFNYATVADAFDRLCEEAKLKWRIDFEKKIRLIDPAAPVIFSTIGVGTGNYEANSLTVEETQEQYFNKVIVRGKRTTIPEATETFDGSHPDQPTNSSRQEWAMSNLVFSAPVVMVNDVSMSVGVAGAETGKDWYWRPSSAYITQDSGGTPLTSGDTIAITYIGEQVNQAFAENSGEIAARATAEDSSGVWERAFELDDPISITDLQSYADNILASKDQATLKCTFTTDDMALIFPGDGIDINLPGLTGGSKTFLVTSMGLSHQTRNAPYVGTNDNRVLRRITCEYGPVMANGYDFFAGLVSAKGGGAGGGSGSPGAAWSDGVYPPGVVVVGNDQTPSNKIVLCPPGKKFAISKIVGGVSAAVTGTDLIADVKRATAAAPTTYATVMSATDASKLVIEVGETIGQQATFAIPYLFTGDRLRDDCIQAGGAAANLRVQIFGQFVPL
jgi:hypothetical protein